MKDIKLQGSQHESVDEYMTDTDLEKTSLESNRSKVEVAKSQHDDFYGIYHSYLDTYPNDLLEHLYLQESQEVRKKDYAVHKPKEQQEVDAAKTRKPGSHESHEKGGLKPKAKRVDTDLDMGTDSRSSTFSQKAYASQDSARVNLALLSTDQRSKMSRAIARVVMMIFDKQKQIYDKY